MKLYKLDGELHWFTGPDGQKHLYDIAKPEMGLLLCGIMAGAYYGAWDNMRQCFRCLVLSKGEPDEASQIP